MYLPDSLNEHLVHLVIIVLIFAYSILLLFVYKEKIKFNAGLLALSILFLSGYALVLQRTDSRSDQHFIHHPEGIKYYKAAITSYVQEKSKSWKVEATMREVHAEKRWKKTEGKILFYFSKEDFDKPFEYGDVLLIKGSPQEIMSPANPGEFDYKRFLTFQKIYHQHFLRKKNVRWIGNEAPSLFMKYAIQARAWSGECLKKYVKGEREQAIASALVLGITDGLDNVILHAYSATGAMHVLAVSGLHVSIIYGMLLFFLKPVVKRRSGPWLVACVSLLLLWAYAFVTGLSPSVLRAVTMFSFVALARPLNWTTNIYNTLSLSAFCLLLVEPYLIMSVGFQLSYLAVLGIVYLQRPLYQMWDAPYWLLDKIWQITTVSMAAQMATVSLGLLYFHQFPVYFIFSNLLVIPVSFAVLVLGLGVLAFSFLGVVASMLGMLLTWAIQLMNFSVKAVEALPYSLLDNLHITTTQSWLIMFALIVGVLLFQYKRFSYLVIAVVVVGLLSLLQWVHLYKEVVKKELIVYKVTGHQAIDLISSGSAFFMADSALKADEEKIRFHIRPYRLQREVKEVSLLEQSDLIKMGERYKLIVWNSKSILILDKKEVDLPSIAVNYVVVCNNAVSIEALQQTITFDKIILDSSNSYYFAEKQRKQAEALHLPIHSVLHHGYFNQQL